MKFDSEKDLENLLCSYVDDYGVCRITGDNVSSYKRQLRLDPYGICDIVTLDGLYSEKSVVVNCMELKVSSLHVDHIQQIARYRKGFERNFGKTSKVWMKFKYTLVCGPPTKGTDIVWLAEAQREWLSIFIYDIDLDGVGFSLLNTGNRRFYDEDSIPIKRDLREFGKYYRDDFYNFKAMMEMGRVD